MTCSTFTVYMNTYYYYCYNMLTFWQFDINSTKKNISVGFYQGGCNARLSYATRLALTVLRTPSKFGNAS